MKNTGQQAVQKMIAAWIEAGKDLKIKIRSPFLLRTGSTTTTTFYLLIEEGGSKLGTVVLSVNDLTEFDTPEKFGYYCSALNPDNYAAYDRKHFIDTLTDWGYFGANEKPDWYVEPLRQ